MKKGKEREIQILEIFCSITAVAAIILSVMFLFDFWQNHWFLSFILALGILLHVAAMICMFMEKKTGRALICGILTLFYAVVLICFNVF